MRILSRRAAALAWLLVLTACQPSARDAQAADARANASAQTAPSTPAEGSRQAVDPEKLLAENDRAIAENKRMIDTLQGYARTDPDKLARLRAGCQRKLGVPFDNGGAVRIFSCIRDSW